MKQKVNYWHCIRLILTLIVATVAFADSISGDADALVLVVPHANN